MNYFKQLKKQLIDTNLQFALYGDEMDMEYMWECQLDGKCPKTELKNMFESQSIFYNANEYKRLVLHNVYTPLQDARYGHYDLQEPVIRLLAFIHSLLNK